MAGLVLVGGIAALIVSAVTVVQSALGPDHGGQALIVGEQASPVAESALVCEGACFSADSIDAVIARDATFTALGFETTYAAGTYDPATAGELYRGDIAGWESHFAGPDACFFAPTSAPYAAAIDERAADVDDPVYFLGTHEDTQRIDTMDQSARLFVDSAAAEAYLGSLATAVSSCDEITLGVEGNERSARVTPAPALKLPDSIAAIGWVREGIPGPGWRAYVIDLQRGNIVVRLRLITDGAVTEHQFRNTVTRYANQLAIVEPVAPVLAR